MYLDFIAGCIGGMAGVVVGHPLDTVKVHLQTQDAKRPKYKGTVDCLRSLLVKEGIRGVYKGVTSPLVGVAGINAIVFGIYGNVQKRMEDAESLKSHAIAGGLAGLFQSFICSPMELAKSRLQVINGVDKSPLDCLVNIHRKSGIRGIFKGLGLTISREIPAFSSYFFTYELLTRNERDEPTSTAKMLFAGGMAGVVSWVIIYPVDMLKSRIQIDGITSTQYNSAFDCLRKTVNAGGISSLFRGLTPTLIRAFPVNAVTFTVVNWTMRLLDGTYSSVAYKGSERLLHKYIEFVGRLNAWEYSLLILSE